MEKRSALALPSTKHIRLGHLRPGERMLSHDPTQVAFGMTDMGSHNSANRNVDLYGGVAFVPHNGKKCFRGVDPLKRAQAHPIETAKRVLYITDGSGRDQYIVQNSGGLTVDKHLATHGTDQG